MPATTNKPSNPKFAYGDEVFYINNGLILSGVIVKIHIDVTNPSLTVDGVQVNQYQLDNVENKLFEENRLYDSHMQAAFKNNGNEYFCDLSNTDLLAVDLKQKSLAYCNLHGADLSAADIDDCDMRGANLENAILPVAVEDKEDLKTLLGAGNYNDDTIYTDGTGINDAAP